MQIYFSARLLSSSDLASEQTALESQRHLPSLAATDASTAALDAQALPGDPCMPGDPCVPFDASWVAESFGPGDPCAPTDPGTPTDPCIPTDPCMQPTDPCAPTEPCLNADLIASLPASLLDTVALNPQPLPPQESTVTALDAATMRPYESAELEMVNLQSLISQRQQAIQLTTNLTSLLGVSLHAIAGNVGK